MTLFTTGAEAVDPEIHFLRWRSDGALSEDPTTLTSGMNSGYQAMSLAYLAGAAQIVLLGYDMKPGPKGEEHWFGKHPRGMASPLPALPAMRQNFPKLAKALAAKGVEVVNCSADTALDCFRREPIESVFPDPPGPAVPA